MLKIDNRRLLPPVNDWILQAPLLLVRGGSWSYGMATPESDVDVKGAVIPPLRHSGLLVSDGFQHAELKMSDAVWPVRPREALEDRVIPVEGIIYGFRKLVAMLSTANPNTLETLFVRDEDFLQVHPLFEPLLENRDVFLTQKIRHTYAGYAFAQLKRIQTHRRWLLSPPERRPERTDFGLDGAGLSKADLATARAAVQKKLDSWELNLDGVEKAIRDQLNWTLTEQWLGAEEKYAAATSALGLGGALKERLLAEQRYRTAVKEWRSFKDWKTGRNPERAALETRVGYDSKHAAHALRLARTGREVLETGQLQVYRPDAEELLDIRQGNRSYEEIRELADREIECIGQVAKTSKLPKELDHERVNTLVEQTLSKAYGIKGGPASPRPKGRIAKLADRLRSAVQRGTV